MKIGKFFKRFGSPSDKFLAKTRKEILTPPSEGPVNLFIDDDRPCPEGWTAIRTLDDFRNVLTPKNEYLDRIAYISFDSHFGKLNISGQDLMTLFAQLFTEDPAFLPNLKAIGLHGKNRATAMEMDKILAQHLTLERKNSFYVHWGIPTLPL